MSALEQHTVIVTSNVNDLRNTSSHFYNVLGKPLDLSRGKWKVAVKKIIYLNSFLNIIDESLSVFRKYKKKTENISFNKTKIDWLERVTIVDGFDVSTFSTKEGVWGFHVFVDTQSPILPTSYKIHITKEDGTEVEFLTGTVYPDNKTFHIFFTNSLGSTISSKLPEDAVNCSVEVSYCKKRDYTIPVGNYETVNDLLNTINSLGISDFNVTMDAGYVSVEMHNQIEWVTLNNDLNLTLGFNQVMLTKSTRATHLPQMNRGRFAFFIYSNLVHNVRVGSMEVPLMDVISIPKQEFAEIVSLDVVNPLYSDVSLKVVHEIEIMLASDSGELIKFDNSVGNAKTLIVLHFMRVI